MRKAGMLEKAVHLEGGLSGRFFIRKSGTQEKRGRGKAWSEEQGAGEFPRSRSLPNPAFQCLDRHVVQIFVLGADRHRGAHGIPHLLRGPRAERSLSRWLERPRQPLVGLADSTRQTKGLRIRTG